MRIPIHYYLIILMFTFSSCQREDSDVITPLGETEEDTSTYFDSNFIGTITDDQGSMLADAVVEINGNKDFSTYQGTYLFNNAKTNSAGTLMKVSKTGYFDQFIYVLKSESDFSNIPISLHKKKDFTSFTNAEGHNFELIQDIQVSIPKDAFITLDGQLYSGQIKLFKSTNDIQGNIRFLNKALKNGVLTNSNSFQLIAETPDGQTLKLVKPINIKSSLVDIKMGKMDAQKEKWRETEGQIESNNIDFILDQLQPFTFGYWSEMTKISTKLTNELNEGISFVKVEIKDPDGHTVDVYGDQDGNIKTYVASNSQITLTTIDFCGSIMQSTNATISESDSENLTPIIINSNELTVLRSKIAPCSQSINQNDLLNVRLSGNSNDVVFYQKNTDQSFIMPRCQQVQKAVYFRGKDQKFSISLGNQSNSSQLLNLNITPLCIEKIVGNYTINDIPVRLEMGQFYIYREAQDQNNLVISDLSGFLISIPKVAGKGKYIPDVIYFSNPTYSECIQNECTEMIVWIDEIGSIGDLVKVRIEGSMKGDRIKGEFVNILKN